MERRCSLQVLREGGDLGAVEALGPVFPAEGAAALSPRCGDHCGWCREGRGERVGKVFYSQGRGRPLGGSGHE